jgi:hypothetical protein
MLWTVAAVVVALLALAGWLCTRPDAVDETPDLGSVSQEWPREHRGRRDDSSERLVRLRRVAFALVSGG